MLSELLNEANQQNWHVVWSEFSFGFFFCLNLITQSVLFLPSLGVIFLLVSQNCSWADLPSAPLFCVFFCHLTTQEMTSQRLFEHIVPISARFHHLVPSLANLSPLVIMNVNTYIGPICISFQDQELSPHLKVSQHKVIWDSEVEKTWIIAFLICQIHWCHTILQLSAAH